MAFRFEHNLFPNSLNIICIHAHVNFINDIKKDRYESGTAYMVHLGFGFSLVFFYSNVNAFLIEPSSFRLKLNAEYGHEYPYQFLIASFSRNMLYSKDIIYR